MLISWASRYSISSKLLRSVHSLFNDRIIHFQNLFLFRNDNHPNSTERFCSLAMFHWLQSMYWTVNSLDFIAVLHVDCCVLQQDGSPLIGLQISIFWLNYAHGFTPLLPTLMKFARELTWICLNLWLYSITTLSCIHMRPEYDTENKQWSTTFYYWV